MDARIAIPDHLAAVVSNLVYDSALYGCTYMGPDADGQTFLAADRPVLSLSSGEIVLFRAVEALCAGQPVDLDTAHGVLDAPNFAALVEACKETAA